MRVLQVSHSAQEGGSNEVLATLARLAPDDVRQACVFLEDGPVVGRLEGLGVPCHVVRSGRAREPWRWPRTIRRLRGAIVAHRADVVLAHVTKAHVYAAPAAAMEGVPELWWQHERQSLQPLLQELAGRWPAAAVLCPSTQIATAQASRWPRTPVRVVAPGVRADPEATPRPHRVTGADATEPLRVGVAGRLVRWKRVEMALRAFPIVAGALPGARLHVIGDSTCGVDAGYPAELRAEVRRLGLDETVVFEGHARDGAAAIAGLDLLVHCAEAEPFGLVLVEALLAGVPVIAADEGGPTEIVRDGVDGLLVDATDAERLAAAIIALGRDPQRRTEMGRAGRERALELFSAERMADEAWAVVRAAQLGDADAYP